MNLPEKYRVMGMDNSLNCTGWCVIDVDNGDIKLIDYGYIDTKKIKDNGDKLVFIEKFFNDIMTQYKPDYISAEAPFVGSNRDTIQKLTQIII